MAIDVTDEFNRVSALVTQSRALRLQFEGFRKTAADERALGARAAEDAEEAKNLMAAYLAGNGPITTPTPTPTPGALRAFVNGQFNEANFTSLANAAGTKVWYDYFFGPGPKEYGTDVAETVLLYKYTDKTLDVISVQWQDNINKGIKNCRPCNLGFCGTYQYGGPPQAGQGGMYSSNQGTVGFIPSNRSAPKHQGGIGVSDLCNWSVSEDIVSSRPELYWGYYGEGRDARNLWQNRDEGVDMSFPVCMGKSEDRPGWDISTYHGFRNGWIANTGHNTGSNRARTRLATGLVPVAICAGNASGIIAVACWDTTNKVGKVAMILAAGTPQGAYPGTDTSKWEKYRGEWRNVYPGLPNYGNTSFMKIVGYLTLADMKTPTSIAMTFNWPAGFYAPFQGYDNQNGFDLSVAATRQALRDGNRGYITPSQGLLVVGSAEEKKATFYDLGPLMRHLRAIYYGTTAPPTVVEGGNFPPNFDQAPAQIPTPIKTITFTEELGCLALAKEGKRAYFGTRDGTIRIWNTGDYPTAGAGNPASITELGTVSVGRNPTQIARVAVHAGDTSQPTYFGTKIYPNADFLKEIIVCCYGDRAIQWVRMNDAMTNGTVIRTAKDDRLKGPVSVQDGSNHTTESYCVTIADRDGNQVYNLIYGPTIFWDHGPNNMSDDPNNPIFYDWKSCLPPNGEPARATVFKGVNYPFHCGGTWAVDGTGPYDFKGGNTF